MIRKIGFYQEKKRLFEVFWGQKAVENIVLLNKLQINLYEVRYH